MHPQRVNVRHVDADTPLMEAGVHSQQAVRLATLLRDLTGAQLSPTLIFEHPTPRAIVSALEASEHPVRDVNVVLLVNDLSGGKATLEAHPQAEIDPTAGMTLDAALPASAFQQHFLLLQGGKIRRSLTITVNL